MAGEVVLGYDGNEGSGAALRTATSIAAAFDRPLVIVFGYRPPTMGGDIADLRRAVREIGEKLTKEAVEAAHGVDASVSVSVELVDDRPADAILRVADEYDALAVVVGATGRGPSAARCSDRSPIRWCTAPRDRSWWFPRRRKTEVRVPGGRSAYRSVAK